MERQTFIITQTMRVSVDSEAFDQCDDFMEAVQNGSFELVEMMDYQVLTEDGEVLYDGSMEAINQGIVEEFNSVKKG